MRGLAIVLALLTLAGCRGGAAPPFDEARAFADLEAQTQFGPRVPGTEGHRRCLAWLERSLTEAGGRVTVQAVVDTAFPLPGVDTLFNVRARFGPENAPSIVLGAHWDTRPWADKDPDSTKWTLPVPGANDGGSGVAVLLEVARALGRTPPPYGVEIVLFDGEDAGNEADPERFCRGSQAYVKLLPHPRPLHVLIVDMVGGKDLKIHPELQSQESAPNLVDRLWEGARRTGAKGFLPEGRFSVYDDHVPFLREGIPAVDLIDMDYPEWHTTRDLPAACSAGSLGQVGRVVLWHLYTLEIPPT